LDRGHWTLPGLTVRIETDATAFAVTPGDGFVDVLYRGASLLMLRTTQP
jgi:hypothetical protein